MEILKTITKKDSLAIYSNSPVVEIVVNPTSYSPLRCTHIIEPEVSLVLDGLVIIGKSVVYSFSSEKRFGLELLNVDPKDITGTAYMTIKDFFTGTKAEYVQYWYRTKERKAFYGHYRSFEIHH